MELNPSTILNELMTGEELTILLPVAELANFKTKLYRLKRAQEEQLVGLEMLSEADIKQLSFSTFPSEDHPGFLEVTMKMTGRPRNTTYVILRKVPSNAIEG